jgi:hypothetical protein
VYFFLTAATKTKVIHELRDYWSTHPRYQDLVTNIQGKYSFKERPQYGIVVRGGNGSKVQFSPNNYMGIVKSHVTLANIPGYPGTSVEWVRENELAIQANNGHFPSPPGVYYCEMTEDDAFYVEPLLDVQAEPVTMVTSSEGVLQTTPYGRSLRLFELPSSRLLRLGADYTVGEDGLTIYFREPVPSQATVVADYRVAGEATGPWKVLPFTGYTRPIPGCVLVFGRRFQKGDRFAVVISKVREQAYEVYGGKWEMSLDLDIIARDPAAQMEIADQTLMFLWATLRPRVIDQGIDIQDVSLGGETEEVFDENADEYFYNSSISMTLQTDWELHVPLVPKIFSFEEALRTLPNPLALTPFRDPFFTTKFTYEVIQ